MNPAPEVPQPIPEIPKRALWLTLGIPPVTALLAGAVLAVSGNDDILPGAALVCILTTFAGLGRFDGLMARRYRGNSAVFLSWVYILGQAIVCATLGLGILVMAALIGHLPW